MGTRPPILGTLQRARSALKEANASQASALVDELEKAIADIEQSSAPHSSETAADAEALSLGEQRFSTTLRSIGDAVIATDAAGRITFMNRVAEELTRVPFRDGAGRHLDEVFRIVSEKTRAVVESPVAKVIRDGAMVGMANHALLVRPDGTEMAIDDSAAPIRTNVGDLAGVVLVFRDVTLKRREEERRRFLDEASRELASSLDYETTLATVARLAVPGFADWAAVDLVTADGAISRLATAHVEPEKVKWVPQGTPNIIRTGNSEMMCHIPEGLLIAAAKDADHLAMLRQLGLRSYVAVPLAARGRILGVITFVTAESGRTYDSDDLQLAEDLGVRAALALDNARLYRAAQQAHEKADEVLPCEVFAGKYVIERELGAGGMGVVMAARHQQLGQMVAIKLLVVPPALRPEAVARFLREAQAAARLRSEHVARVMDAGTDERGRHYIVMEYLHGADLGQVLQAGGPLSIADAVGYLLQACEGIAEAHANGIVHRDLKPENLFLTHRIDGSPLVKVLDFGISKMLVSETGPALLPVTDGGTLMGSPLYMSPEQLRTPAAVDGRSDVWALGVILYQLLSARMPFAGGEIPDVMAAVLTSAPAPLRTLRPDLPPELEIVVTAALEKDPDRRVPNVAVLAGALRAWAPRWARDSAARAARTLGLGERGTTSTDLGWAARAAAVAPANRGGAAEGPGDDGAGTPSRWSGWLRSRPRASKIVVAAATALVVLVIGLAVTARLRRSPAASDTLAAASPAPAKAPSRVKAPIPSTPAPLAPPAPAALAAPVRRPAPAAPWAEPPSRRRGRARSAPITDPLEGRN